MFRTCTDVMRTPVAEKKENESSDRIYICDFCSEGWASETEVEYHRSTKHRNVIAQMMKSVDKYICKMCIVEFNCKASLVRHIKTEHLLSSENAIRVEREIFICADCGELFFNKLLLTYHIIKTHSCKEKNDYFKCPRCYKNIRLATCWYHFLNHKMQSIAVCKICLLKCRDRLTLAEHLKTHKNIYRCELCGYDTKKKELFNIHIQRFHKRYDLNVDYEIKEWNKFFMPQQTVRKWRRMYLMGWKGVKLTNDVYICILCREICIGIGSMERHILIDHQCVKTSQQSYYPCTCGMVFTNKLLYKHHLFKSHHNS